METEEIKKVAKKVTRTKTDAKPAAMPKEKTQEMSEKKLDSYSIIKTGGKQHIAEKGTKLRIEKLEGDHKEGDVITFDEVLMTADAGVYSIGSPFIAGAKVSAKIVEITRDPKLIVLRYRAKSRYHKKNGHRQPKFVVEII